MIAISKDVYESMIAHARAGYPNEACGLLAGPAQASDPAKADFFYPMKNVDGSAVSYFMDPKEQLETFKKMRRKAQALRGIFHSHVASEAYPSQKDVRLAFYPDASYLIVSLSEPKEPVLRSFRVADEKVTEEEIQVV